MPVTSLTASCSATNAAACLQVAAAHEHDSMEVERDHEGGECAGLAGRVPPDGC